MEAKKIYSVLATHKKQQLLVEIYRTERKYLYRIKKGELWYCSLKSDIKAVALELKKLYDIDILLNYFRE